MKETLGVLIEAYAAARPTGNSLLQEFAAVQLNQFLAKYDLVEISEETASTVQAEVA